MRSMMTWNAYEKLSSLGYLKQEDQSILSGKSPRLEAGILDLPVYLYA